LIFAYAEDGMLWVFEHEAAAKTECEPIDVESLVFVFYAEDGTWLRPEFLRPNRQSFFGLLLEQGEYRLVPAPERPPEVDPIEVALAECAGVVPNPHFRSAAEVLAHVEVVRSGAAGK
jgi:hypothetical protein